MSEHPSTTEVIAAAKAVSTLRWVTPLERGQVIADLRRALRDGGTVGEWRYNEIDGAKVEDALSAALLAVEADRTIEDQLAAAVFEDLDRKVAAYRAIASRDDEVLAAWSDSHYPRPAAELKDLGLDGFRQKEDDHDDSITALELVGRIEGALAAYALGKWTVWLSDDLVPNMSVRPLSNAVQVRSTARFNEAEVRRLLVHEIGSHVLRAANSQQQPESFAALSLGDSSPTEEGLAAWHEQKFAEAEQDNPRYAVRLLAVDLARTGGVVDVARTLEPIVGLDDAMNLAIRVKRGFRDPNRSGAFGKDQSYFLGYRRVKHHLDAYPWDLPRLMATKWAIEYLPLFERLEVAGLVGTDGLRVDQRLLDLVCVPSRTSRALGDDA